MKYPLSTFAVVLLFSSCLNTPNPPVPAPITPSKTLGLMELGFENLATGFSSSAQWLQSSNLSSQALSTQPGRKFRWRRNSVFQHSDQQISL